MQLKKLSKLEKLIKSKALTSCCNGRGYAVTFFEKTLKKIANPPTPLSKAMEQTLRACSIGSAYYHPLNGRRCAPSIKRLKRTTL